MVPGGQDARGLRLIQASSGDEEHAARVAREVERAERVDRRRIPSSSADVPRESVDHRERVPLGVLEEARRPSRPLALGLWLVCGLTSWALIFALAFGVYELVRWLG